MRRSGLQSADDRVRQGLRSPRKGSGHIEVQRRVADQKANSAQDLEGVADCCPAVLLGRASRHRPAGAAAGCALGELFGDLRSGRRDQADSVVAQVPPEPLDLGAAHLARVRHQRRVLCQGGVHQLPCVGDRQGRVDGHGDPRQQWPIRMSGPVPGHPPDAFEQDVLLRLRGDRNGLHPTNVAANARSPTCVRERYLPWSSAICRGNSLTLRVTMRTRSPYRMGPSAAPVANRFRRPCRR
ncbi:unannotated protein [freshwater metagenome]|uniref:Unannotated protein n=1 Tax=freshwater metagenome TaxID=449393 RepID=A0A6J7AS18_9ZZZZ